MHLHVMQLVSISNIFCNWERIFISDTDKLDAYDDFFKCNAWRKCCKFGYHCFDMSGLCEVSFSFNLPSMAFKQSMTVIRRLWLAFQTAILSPPRQQKANIIRGLLPGHFSTTIPTLNSRSFISR